MNETKLKEILRLHLLWLNNSEGGRRADLTGANLTDADLTGADLRGADLRGAVGVMQICTKCSCPTEGIRCKYCLNRLTDTTQGLPGTEPG